MYLPLMEGPLKEKSDKSKMPLYFRLRRLMPRYRDRSLPLGISEYDRNFVLRRSLRLINSPKIRSAVAPARAG